MQRTLNQNRFYYSIIKDVHQQALAEHLTVEDSEFLRDGLKKNDPDYPRVDDKPISSAKLDTKQMVDHIEFIIEYLGQFGICPQFVTDEWERLKARAYFNKG